MKVRLLSIGRDRSGLFEPIVQEYAQRLKHYCKFELLELPEGRKERGPEAAMEEEARAVLARLKPGELLVAMDERGRTFTSRQFGGLLEKFQSQGGDVTFVIGGAEGLHESIRARAVQSVSLSAMTMPHRLARAVLAEQLYRGFTLLKGEPYHRD